MSTLVFIDTNILLDFYRLESREAGLTILEKIDAHREDIITGDQIAMEFKKNRQKVILDVHRSIKTPDYGPLPPVLVQTKASKSFERHKKGVRTQTDRLKRRLQSVMKDPSRYDPVFRTVQRLVGSRGEYNLSRDKDIRRDIRELAKKRFVLGYPPRKPGDTCIGDAINWEWVIHCAIESGAGIVIVTRDSDYGSVVDGQLVLNDWLQQEFKERVGRRRKIQLTDRLSVGFKAAAIEVTRKEEEAESALLKAASPSSTSALERRIVELFGNRVSVGFDAVLSKRDTASEDA
jgi:hypothetical protein